MEKAGIDSRPLWKTDAHATGFQGVPSYTNGVSEYLFTKGLCLPSGTALTSQEMELIVGKITETGKGQ